MKEPKNKQRYGKVFSPGDRVVRPETGETGTIRTRFLDGSVTLQFDDGRFAELDSENLEPLVERRSPRSPRAGRNSKARR